LSDDSHLIVLRVLFKHPNNIRSWSILLALYYWCSRGLLRGHPNSGSSSSSRRRRRRRRGGTE